MKIRIERERCVGNARCWAVAPEHYPLDEDGYINIVELEVSEGEQNQAVRGARACPERIIKIVEQ